MRQPDARRPPAYAGAVDHERDFWIRSAVQAARNPSSWLHHAETLRRAADQLAVQIEDDKNAYLAAQLGGFTALRSLTEERRLPTTFVYAMLMGYAIENLAKGLIVAADPYRVQEADALFEGSWGHISVQLLREAGAEPTDDERKTVRRLETAVLWTGRYPVAKKALRMRYRLARQPPPGYWDGSDTNRAEAIFDRLAYKLHEAALSNAARNEKEAVRTMHARRTGVLAELVATCTARREGEVILYERTGVPADPGTAVTCVRCGSNFTLNSQTVGAVCECQVVYRNEPYYDGALGRWIPLARLYPPPA